jgi:hypothetical protein
VPPPSWWSSSESLVSDLVFLHCNLQKVRTEKHKHPPTQVGKKHFVHAQVLLSVLLFYALLHKDLPFISMCGCLPEWGKEQGPERRQERFCKSWWEIKQAAKAWDAKCSASLTHFPVSWSGGTSIISSSELERNYYTICMGLNCT